MNRCFHFASHLIQATRCTPRWTATLTLLAACWTLTAPSNTQAQTLTGTKQVTNAQGQTITVRTFPPNAKRGELEVTTPPNVRLDGKAERLSPGARIRGTNNLLVLSASISGQKLPVMYSREAMGMLHEVWLLTADEALAYPAKPHYSAN